MSRQRTRCPKCSTAFHITKEQLAQANGYVRCGSCLEVFEATLYIEKVSRTKTTQPKAATPKQNVKKQTSSTEQEKPKQKTISTTNTVLKEQAKQTAALIAKQKKLAKEAALKNEALVKHAPVTKVPLSSDDDKWINDLIAELEGSPKPKKTPVKTPPVTPKSTDKKASKTEQIAEPAAQAKPAPTEVKQAQTEEPEDSNQKSAAASPTTEPSQEKETLHKESQTKETKQVTSKSTEPKKVSVTAPEPGTKKQSSTTNKNSPLEQLPMDANAKTDANVKVEDSVETVTSEEKQSAAPNDEITPSFLEEKKRSTKTNVLWFCLSILASLTLGGQYLFWNFASAANSETLRPLLVTTCNIINCNVPLYENLAALKTEKLIIRKLPNDKNKAQVDALIVNSAPIAQEFPTLRILFDNQQDNAVTYIDIESTQYLTGDLQQLSEMPPKTPIHVQLNIKHEQPLLGYQLKFIKN